MKHLYIFHSIFNFATLLLCGILITLSACSDDNNNIEYTQRVKFTQTGINPIRYKRITSNSQWNGQEKVGILSKKRCYAYTTDSKGNLTPISESDIIYWADQPKETFKAFYPYNTQDIVNNETINYFAEYNEPLLFSEVKNANKGDFINFQFQYKVAAVMLCVKFDNDITDNDITAKVVETPLTATFNIQTGTFKGKGTSGEYDMKDAKNPSVKTLYAYVIPHEGSVKIKINYNKKDEEYTFKTNKAEEGKGYRLNLFIDKNGEVVKWQEVTIEDMEDINCNETDNKFINLPTNYQLTLAHHIKYLQQHFIQIDTIKSDDNAIDKINGVFMRTFPIFNTNGEAIVRINPYFGNFAAQALLDFPTKLNQEIVKQWINWYIAHLNKNDNPDPQDDNITGSIWDYQLHFCKDGTKKIELQDGKQSMDSSDSYAATFISLIRRFARLSDDNKQWLLDNYKQDISNVYKAILYLFKDQKNGGFPYDLTIAKPSYEIMYLMDNCEVNQAFKDAIDLVEMNLLDTNKEDIEEMLNRQTTRILDPDAYEMGLQMPPNETDESINGGFKIYFIQKNTPIDWKKPYPDVMAQIFPIIFQIRHEENVEEPYEAQQWDRFKKNFPDWQNGVSYGNGIALTIFMRAATARKDKEWIDAYINNYLNNVFLYSAADEANEHWGLEESAHVVMAFSNYIENQCNTQTTP